MRFRFEQSKTKRLSLTGLMLLFTVLLVFFQCQGEKDLPNQKQRAASRPDLILEKIGLSRGICVILGDTTGQTAIDLAMTSELLLYLQLPRAETVEAIRREVDAVGLLGTQIYVESGKISRLHLGDNLADAIIVLNDVTQIPKNELMRVLRPGGKAVAGGKIWEKPFPKGVDDWSHPYHGPDNNTQSDDQIIKAPYLTQFLAEPRYAPLTQAAVAAAGRVFKAFGNVAFHTREEPYLNTLVAFNGFNGTRLWTRDLVPGIMVHRNTMIATPDILFVGDDKSCKMIDAVTGRLLDEISPPVAITGGTHWKWMGMENDVLYALIGKQEQKDATMRWRRKEHGWPWNAISKGFNQPEHRWGFGKNLLAIDPVTKNILWRHHESEAMDTRALCMKNKRIFIFRFGTYLACLNAQSGNEIWRKTPENAPELFNALGSYLNRQSWETNWRTRNFLLCSDQALYFAGPQIGKLLAVSAKDGQILWENPYNNFQLILREDGLYGIGGPWRDQTSKKFDPLTGQVLAELATGRRACTRPNGSSDAIFYRAMGGTVRLDLATGRPNWISPMRPPCHDGVTIANGHLYWWPSICDCQLSIYGITALGPAGDFDFSQSANDADRLEISSPSPQKSESLMQTRADWPTFRKNNVCDVTTEVKIPATGRAQWVFPADRINIPGTDLLGQPRYRSITAPVTVDGIVFYGNSEGKVFALDVQSGDLMWTAYTGGAIRLPPTVWNSTVLVGSGDGWVYSFDAKTGAQRWRFRAAPIERKIPVYGALLSTWPAAGGVLVADGIAYIAAGILNYDGIHVYALDAETGKLKWQNNTSGHLDAQARTGVSVQGHLLLHDRRLYLPGGTSVSPAVYNISDGKCLNDPEPLKKCESTSPRGWELFKVGNQVVVGGKPFYSHPLYPVYDISVTEKMLLTSQGDLDIVWQNNQKVKCYRRLNRRAINKSTSEQKFSGHVISPWGKLGLADEVLWEYNCNGSVALAVGKNAVVIAEKNKLVVLNLKNGKELWSQPLAYQPVPWGLALSRDGRILLSLENGSIACFGGPPTVPFPYLRSNSYFVKSTRIDLACDTPGIHIHYTTDGSAPNLKSTRFHKPIEVEQTTLLKMRTFKQEEAQSFVVTREIQKLNYHQNVEPGQLAPGVFYDYYESVIFSSDELTQLKPLQSGIMPQIQLKIPKEEVTRFGFQFSGIIEIPTDGIYTFFLESNDGSKFFLDGKQVIDNDGDHGAIEKSNTIALKAGKHPILIRYYQAGGGKALKLSWESKAFKKQEVPDRVLFHVVPE